jgi:hypothetical protein
MPKPWINFRLKIRGDFASAAVLGPIDATTHRRSQRTAGGISFSSFEHDDKSQPLKEKAMSATIATQAGLRTGAGLLLDSLEAQNVKHLRDTGSKNR